jgi:hypothetical protein
MISLGIQWNLLGIPLIEAVYSYIIKSEYSFYSIFTSANIHSVLNFIILFLFFLKKVFFSLQSLVSSGKGLNQNFLLI